KAAPYILIFATDRESLQKNGRGKENWTKWTYVAVGAMTQQIYLAADSLGIGCRYIESMDRELARRILSLPADEEPVCLFPLGKR
ncbi:MAG: nitroreductase family protein, partial [Planctomycetota bacterium]|nr:nitroreductase family protein [Planctomycetota bacterium]